MNKIINKQPIIGFVRYSQKIKFGNKERNVFEPKYFEYRFNIFKKVTLKSFQQQTNSNFALFLLHSENMPPHYKERFIELENETPFLYNIFVEDTWESFNEAISKSIDYVSFKNDAAITFRIDNDDAVQKDFIEKLNGFLHKEFTDNIVSIPTMYRVKRIEKEMFLLENFYFPANAIGMAYVTGSEIYKTVMQLGEHDLVNNENTMILLPKSTNGGLMTINGENELNSIDYSKSKIYNNETICQFLEEKKLGDIDLNCLRVYQEKKSFSRFSFNKIIDLIMPPIFKILIKK